MIGNRMLGMMQNFMPQMGQMPGGMMLGGGGGNSYANAMASPWIQNMQNFAQQLPQMGQQFQQQGYGVQGGTGAWAGKLRDRMQGAYQGQATNSAYPGG